MMWIRAAGGPTRRGGGGKRKRLICKQYHFFFPFKTKQKGSPILLVFGISENAVGEIVSVCLQGETCWLMECQNTENS